MTIDCFIMLVVLALTTMISRGVLQTPLWLDSNLVTLSHPMHVGVLLLCYVSP